MPSIAGDRDLDLARVRLAAWLAARMPEARELRLSEISQPPSTGFSNETLLFDCAWTERGAPRRRGLVARVKATRFHVFPEYDVERQYRILEILGAKTDVPVPRVLGYEADEALLGAPFFVMERMEGRVPDDNPPYHAAGWVTEVSPGERAEMWWDGVEMLARIHTLDWRALGLGFVEMPGEAATPIGRQLDYYERFLEWAAEGSSRPLETSVLYWLRQHAPRGDEPVRLSWGDSRLGNLMFRGGRCIAVFDWEMATLASPMADLAWWIYFDRHHSEGCDLPRLEGFPSREATIARYRSRTGFAADHLDYYEIFAALRFSVIMIRVLRQLVSAGMLPAEFEKDNTASRMLAKLVDGR